MTYTQSELEAWAKEEIGQPCKQHPWNIIKLGKYGNICGDKDELGRWCNGSMPTQAWLNNYRLQKAKEQL